MQLLNSHSRKKYLYFSLLLISVFFYFSFTSPAKKKINLLSKLEKLAESGNFDDFQVLIKEKNFLQELSTYSCVDKGRISHFIGKTFYVNNLEHDAIQYFKKAVYDDWKKCSEIPKSEIYNSLYNIGISYQYTDDILLGKSYIDSALILIAKLPDYPNDQLAMKYQGAGAYYSDVRDFIRSETYLQNAIKLSSHLDNVDAFYIHIDLLALYLKFKKYKVASNLIEEINTKYIKVKNNLLPIDKATFYLNSAEVFLRQKNHIQAEDLCKKVIALLPKSETNILSNAHEILGAIYYAEKKYDLSKANYEEAYKLRVQENNIVQAQIAKSFSLENLAELDLINKNFSAGLNKINEAIALNTTGLKIDKNKNPIINNQQVSNGYHLLRQLSLKEKIIYEDVSQNKEVRVFKCLDIHYKLDSLVDNVLSNAFLDKAKLALLDNMANHSSRAINLCLEMYELSKENIYLEKAFYFSSRSKSILLQKLIENNKNLSLSADNAVAKGYTKLNEQLSAVQILLQERPLAKDSLLKEFSNIQLNFDQFEKKNNLNSFNKNESKNVVSISDIQKKMSKSTLVIDMFSGEEDYILFYIFKNKCSYKKIKKSAIDNNILKLKKSFISPSEAYDNIAAKALYESLIKTPILNDVHISKISIIPDGNFHGLPVEALIDEKNKYLVEKYAFGYAYVSSMLFNKKTIKYTQEFVGFGTSYTKDLKNKLILKGINVEAANLGKLLISNEELNACNNLFKEKYFLEHDASIDNFYKHALKSRIIYLSLHGIVDKEEGSQSCLVFDDRNNSFLLRAYELHQRPIASDLVVLSACHTADGKLQSGEGIDGITRAFLASGVNKIVSSIWSASEGSAMKILPQFLKKYHDGIPTSTALQQSKIDYLHNAPPNLRHPYYWANYILVGNEAETSNINFYIWSFIFILLILFVVYFLKNK